MSRKNRNRRPPPTGEARSPADDDWVDEPLDSKSSAKRELKARQQQVMDWIKLPLGQLKKLPIDEELVEQLLINRDQKADSGRSRNLRYVAKRIDEEDFANVEAFLEDAQRTSLAAVQIEKACEKWRDAILEGDDGLTAFFDKNTNADHQTIRHTARKARAEIGTDKPPVAQRKLFKLIRETLSPEED